MVHEYKDRGSSDIYNDITRHYENIEYNGNRDDEDAYQAAIHTILDYLQAGRQEFAQYGENGTTKDNINFVFRPFYELWEQFQKEHDALEANDTRHYNFITDVEKNIQKLAARIDDAERETLINLEIHDAKYEMIHGSSIFVKDWEDEDGAFGHYERMIDAESIPGDPHHSYTSTPPFLTGAANGKNFSEVLADIKSNNPDLTPGMTFTLDYSRSLDPSMGTIIVNADGKFNGMEVPVYEGVRVYSSRYLVALDKYSEYNSYVVRDIAGQLNSETNRLNDILVSKIGNAENYSSFYQLLSDIEDIPEFSDAIKILYRKNSPLRDIFEEEFRRGNKGYLIEFLYKSEAKLDSIIWKAKRNGLEVGSVDSSSSDLGIVYASFSGENYNTPEYFFRDGQNGRKGQLQQLSKGLYDCLNDNKGSLKAYLAERLRNKRDEEKYSHIELTQRVINEADTELIKAKDMDNKKKEYDLKVFGLTQLSNLCVDFANRNLNSNKIRPSELVKTQNYIRNLLRDLERHFNNGRYPTKDKRKEIINELKIDWISFKSNDGNRASMTDPTARTYIEKIMTAKNMNEININIRNLGQGMTFLGNTTGQFAVDQLVEDSKQNRSEGQQLLDDPKLDTYRKKIYDDFNVKVDEETGVVTNKGPSDDLYKAWLNGDFIEANPGKKTTYNNLLKYFINKGYLPQGTKCEGDVYNACSRIWDGLYQKEKMLKDKKYTEKWKVNDKTIKEQLKIKQENYKRRNNLTEKEEIEANYIDILLKNDNYIKDEVEKQNKAMETSIMYGDMQGLISSFDPYFMKTGGGFVGDTGKYQINDRYGTGGLFDFTDENSEFMSDLLGQIAVEVIICAISIAAGAVTAGAGALAVQGIRAAIMATRAGKIINGFKRIEMIAKIFRGVGSSVNAMSRYAGKLGKLALEGVGFHISNVMLHNFIEGRPLGSDLNMNDSENLKGLAQSVAFLGVLKAANIPISAAMSGIKLSAQAITNGFGRFFAKTGASIASIGLEMSALGFTDQALSLAFDGELKNITLEDFIHSLGMVLGLRGVGLIKNGAKIQIKRLTSKEIEYEINGERFKVRINKNGEPIDKPKKIEPPRDRERDPRDRERDPKDRERDPKDRERDPKDRERDPKDRERDPKDRERDQDNIDNTPAENNRKGNKDKASKDYNAAIEDLGSGEGLTGIEKIKYDTKKQQYEKIKDFCEKTNFMSEHDLYKIFNERISGCESEGGINEFLTRRNETLEFFSGDKIKFRDAESKEMREGNIYDYGESLFGDKFETKECQELRKCLEKFMFDQTLDNPLQYNSHGFDHSILVDGYSQMIINERMVTKVAEKYGISKTGAKVFLRFAAVCHDFGYPRIGGKKKAMHGLEGGLLFQKEIAPKFREVMKIYGENGTNVKLDDLVNDLRDAISYHSADKIEEPPYKFKIKTEYGDLLVNENISSDCLDWIKENYCKDGSTIEVYTLDESFQNSTEFKNLRDKFKSKGIEVQECKLDPERGNKTYETKVTDVENYGTKDYYQGRQSNGKDRMGIEVQDVDLYENEVAATVRLADNMDAGYNRLNNVQHDPLFMDLMANLGFNEKRTGENPPASKFFQALEGIYDTAKKVEEGKLKIEVLQEKVNDFLKEYGEVQEVEIFTYNADAGVKREGEGSRGTMTVKQNWLNTIKDQVKTLADQNEPTKAKEAKGIIGDILKDFKKELVKDLDYLETGGDQEKRSPFYDNIVQISQEGDTGSYSFRHVAGLTPNVDVVVETFSDGGGAYNIIVDSELFYNSDLSNQKVSESEIQLDVNSYHHWRFYDASGRVAIDGQVGNVLVTNGKDVLVVMGRCSGTGEYIPYYTLTDGKGNMASNSNGKIVLVEEFDVAKEYYQTARRSVGSDFTPADKKARLDDIIANKGKTFAELQEKNKNRLGLQEGETIDDYKDDSRLLKPGEKVSSHD